MTPRKHCAVSTFGDIDNNDIRSSLQQVKMLASSGTSRVLFYVDKARNYCRETCGKKDVLRSYYVGHVGLELFGASIKGKDQLGVECNSVVTTNQ